MLNTKFSPWPCYSEEEADAVKSVLLSNKVNYWTGTEARSFEKEYAHYIGVEYAVAVANGTLALELALRALDIGDGDEVIVTPRTFFASISCVVNVGATPVFADVDLNSQNIEANTIEAAISPKTKAIIVVHLAGMPADMDPIMALADKHDIKVIEDCAQAHGAEYKGLKVGSIGHVGAWSFCQDKILTTGGEGGMVTTNDKDLWSRMWSYKDHGKSWDAVYNQDHPPGFRWFHESFGTNWRMTEMQAAIGRIQLKRLPAWVEARREYSALLGDLATSFSGLRQQHVPDYMFHSQYRYYLFVNNQFLKEDWDRDRIVQTAVDRGVPCYHGSCAEVYHEKAFDDTGLRPKSRLPNAKALGESSMMFLVHPSLKEEEMARIIEILKGVFEEAFVE